MVQNTCRACHKSSSRHVTRCVMMCAPAVPQFKQRPHNNPRSDRLHCPRKPRCIQCFLQAVIAMLTRNTKHWEASNAAEPTHTSRYTHTCGALLHAASSVPAGITKPILISATALAAQRTMQHITAHITGHISALPSITSTYTHHNTPALPRAHA